MILRRATPCAPLLVLTVDGSASDRQMLSNVDVDVKLDLSNTWNKLIENIEYAIDSTRLGGRISVMTRHPVMWNLATGREFPTPDSC